MAIVPEASVLASEMSIRTSVLEMEYERAIAASARLLDTEKDRARRMETLLLQFEYDALRLQLGQANEQLLGMTQTEAEVRRQLVEAHHELDRMDNSLQSSSNENQRLTTELQTLNTISMNHDTLLAEKVQLARELSNLKSELERSNEGQISHLSLVAERHAMERQLNSLEVQLKNEKLSHEHTRARVVEQATEIDNLSSRVEKLQNELSREIRTRQHQEREDQQQNGGWESQRAVLEGKIETLRKQLRSTKDKLQEAQHSLQQQRSTTRSTLGDEDEIRPRMVPLQGPGPSADYHGGLMIATPGAVRVEEKAKRKSALPGDKSAFSITPFLNRTGAARDSAMSSDMDEDEIEQAMDENPPSFRKPNTDGEMRDRNLPPAKRAGPDRVPSNAVKTKPKEHGLTSQPKQSVHRPSSKTPHEESDESEHFMSNKAQAKPKRRKLGMQRERNLFDEENHEEMIENSKPGRKLVLGAAGRNSTKPVASLSSALTNGCVFGGGFSPLKKDRKRL
ncbi:hypothetical protein N7462_009870 [Penicillium macrosclerotiorum]|uniref:uncharacterized protein n=1 Tax=Penicillium macrosclerotiorum TaxID=303699 RepID=UPI002548651F|nr:uncharacterized protein N7462_009870 [Penicillium macrosclerotiorum]KAJ5668800.1 hypothetical protein N7462_009870 [Penicillium macrosclerotiorum]